MRFGYKITSKAAVIGNHLDQGRYILVNQTAALLQGIEENCPSYVGKVNTVVTRSQTRQSFHSDGLSKGDSDRDQGTSFMSRLTVKFFNRFGIKVSRSSVYHPQSNPVERFHRTVKRVLKVSCIEAAPNWEIQVPAALFALRTVTYESSDFSPAELIYGNNLRTPVTLLYESCLDPEEKEDTVVEYVFELINRLKKCRDLAMVRMEEVRDRRKK
ncbi:retrovirus-related Pol polyprotein from transposon 17.6 [Trichonephila clavipes]|uniref:Retrovirus-related Pol polyprotein from transposon 17.6 n=1 Tax=Trichonephila clavipes TaxID=2585209 RepID=A0A8X6VBH5_TRICX|nr:retrovirus-related Pol polyprotein from transposon 17.6 [Trichonephila clavipes]